MNMVKSRKKGGMGDGVLSFIDYSPFPVLDRAIIPTTAPMRIEATHTKGTNPSMASAPSWPVKVHPSVFRPWTWSTTVGVRDSNVIVTTTMPIAPRILALMLTSFHSSFFQTQVLNVDCE